MCQTTFFPPLSLVLLLCPAVYISFLGERERGNEGAGFNSCIRFFSSQIFSVTRFIHLLHSAAYAALLIVCNGWTVLVHRAEGMGRGETGLLPDWLPQLPSLCSPPKYPDVVVLLRNTFVYGFGVLVRYKIGSWSSSWRSLCNKFI